MANGLNIILSNLQLLGFPAYPVDRMEEGVREFQLHYNRNYPEYKALKLDGVPGRNTRIAIGRAHLGHWPKDKEITRSKSIRAFYDIGKDNMYVLYSLPWQYKHMTTISFPFELEFDSGYKQWTGKSLFVNKLYAEQLKGLIEDSYAQNKLPSINGCFCIRYCAGSRDKVSIHSFALALDGGARGNRMACPPALYGEEHCILDFIKLAEEKYGMRSGGRFAVCDFMHLQKACLGD